MKKQKRLVLFIHGWLLSDKHLLPLIELMRNDHDFMNTTFEIYPYDARRFSNERMEDIAANFEKHIRNLFAQTDHDNFIIVGHSIGGLIARRAYLLALKKKSEWTSVTNKIVLIGTPNRGSMLAQYNVLERGWMHLMEMIDQMQLIRDAFRGSKFITDLRLDWVREFRGREDNIGDSKNLPIIVQITCEKDFRVKREDSLDITQFGNTQYVEVKDETHESVIIINDRNQEKYNVIKSALLSHQPAVGGGGGYMSKTDCLIRNVTFFLHGIRTKGEWTKEAAKVLQSNRDDILVLWPNFGFFSIAKFLWGPSRRARVHWFRDQYANAFVKHPMAKFNFVGHSFGTYIAANAIKEFRSIILDRIYFAGSVVPADFPWSKYLGEKQISCLRNDCASIDLPVGFLCNALNHLGVKKLGVGGYAGFIDKSDSIYQNIYLDVKELDGHSVALNKENFDSIKSFILEEDPSKHYLPAISTTTESPKFMSHFFTFSRLYFLTAVMILVIVGSYLIHFPLFFAFYLVVLAYFLWWF